MKKWIAAFFVLVFVLVLSVASADMVSISELRQQVEAIGRWTQTYEAHGRARWRNCRLWRLRLTMLYGMID